MNDRLFRLLATLQKIDTALARARTGSEALSLRLKRARAQRLARRLVLTPLG